MPQPFRLLAHEKRATAALASVYMARMYGLFILLPILAVAAEKMPQASPLLVGIALGIYGLPQIFLHVVFGQWSDRIGRKPVILFGVLLFILGSIVAANADTIAGIIVGRFLQGCGAIGAVVMAFASDLIRAEHRSKVFALLGLSIGISFLLAFLTGPLFYEAWNLSGVFVISALFALLSGLLVLFLLPSPSSQPQTLAPQQIGFLATLCNQSLLRLNVGAFVLHFVLVANFLVLPGLIEHYLGMEIGAHWKVYVPVLIVSFFLMLPFLLIAERWQKLKLVMFAMVAVLIVSQWLMQMPSNATQLILSIVLFFIAFHYLEANMPSLVSRICPPSAKGVSLGVFMQSQFLGTVMGGVAGGLMIQMWGTAAVFFFTMALAVIWLVFIFGWTPCSKTSNINND